MKATPAYPHRGLKTVPALLAMAGVLMLGLSACDSELEPGGAGTEASTSSTPATPAQTSPQASPASRYRLASNGKALIDSAGARIPIDPKAVTGYVDAVVPNGGAIDLAGWAAPADLSRPADTIVAIVGDKSVATVPPSGNRPDVAEGYDQPGLAKSGYVISVQKSSLDCSAPSQGLKVLGVAGDVAGPLEWLGDVPELVAGAC